MAYELMNEIVKHIRNVQFYLLATCFVFVATTWSSSQYLVRPALEQLKQIETVLDEWTPTAIRETAEPLLDSLDATVLQRLATSYIPGTEARPEMRLRSVLLASIVRASPDVRTDNLDRLLRVGADAMQWRPNKSRTLAHFSRFWNELNTANTYVQIRELSDRAYLYLAEWPREPAESETVTLHHDRLTNNRDAITLECELLPGNEKMRSSYGIPQDEEATHFLWCYVPHPDAFPERTWQVAIACDRLSKAFSWRPLRSLCRSSQSEWRAAEFARAFPELVKTTGGIDDFKLNQLHRVLLSRLDEDFGRLEYFGVQFPVARILVIGSPLILLLQFYLFLHLGGLERRCKSVDDLRGIAEPWIGLYDTRLARGASFMVIGIVPWLAQTVLFIRGLEHLRLYESAAIAPIVITAIVVSRMSTDVMRQVCPCHHATETSTTRSASSARRRSAAPSSRPPSGRRDRRS